MLGVISASEYLYARRLTTVFYTEENKIENLV